MQLAEDSMKHSSLCLSLLLIACGDPQVPPAPTVDEAPSLTNADPLTLGGSAEPGATVEVRGGAEVASGTADDSGAFTVDVSLRPDVENTLLVSQVVDGMESTATTIEVTHDGMPPAAPSLDDPITPTRLTTQTLRGSSEVGATVTVEGGTEPASATVDADGRFAVDVMLDSSASDPVDNALEVSVIDAAGNRGPSLDVTITFDPNLPVEAPRFDDPPAFHGSESVTLTGDAEPGVGVTVIGGATPGATTVGSDGAFSVDVGLRPNAMNTLVAFAVSGTDTSPTVELRITHDDVAPDAPSLDAQATPTGAAEIQLSGLAEPHATVEVSGAAADASGAADDTGAFSFAVTLTVDATNDLEVLARDRAGNASDPTTLSITQDSSLEAPVRVDPVSSPTASPTITLTGSSDPSVTLEITGGASPVTTMSDGSGAWTADVDLNANAINELRVTRVGSGVDAIVSVEHDDVAPSAPSLNTLPSPTSNTTIEVTGTTEARGRVSVTGGAMPAAATAALDGRFIVTVDIPADAETTLSVLSTDQAGNTSAPSMATVAHSSSVPAAPTLDETNPAPTNAPTYDVTGRVDTPGPSVMALVRGGASDAMAATDPSTGEFSVTVTLTANSSNVLRAVSVEGALESAEATATVLHDDIAPANPDVSALSASAGGCVLGIPATGTVSGSAGAVEARARVEIENTTRSTSTTASADDMGSFSVGLPSCAGDRIRVIAVDAATNASGAVEVDAS